MKEKDQYIDLYKKYRETLGADDFQMAALWDDIGIQLDLDEVWLGVENELDKDKIKRRGLWMFFFGILILSAILILYFSIPEKITADNINSIELDNNNNNNNNNKDLKSDYYNIVNSDTDKEKENKIHPETAANQNSGNPSESKEIKEVRIDKVYPNNTSLQNIPDINAPLDKIFSELNNNNNNNAGNRNDIKEITHSETPGPMALVRPHILREIEYEEEPHPQIKFPDRIRRNKFAAGFIYNPSFLLINDNLWQSSMDDNSLVSSSLNLEQSVGGYFDYSFHRQFSIRATVSYQRLSQDYQYYIVESQFNHVRETAYFQFYKLRAGAGYKKRLAILKANFESHLGFYLGYMETGHGIHYGGDKTYHKMDMGLNADLGISWDIKRFNLAVGIQGDKGCRNIYKGNEEIPPYLNKTYLNSFGGFLSIGYYLD